MAPRATQRQSTMHKGSLSTHRLEYCLIGLIINPIPEGIVDSIVLAFACTNVLLEGKTGQSTRSPQTALQTMNRSPGVCWCNLNVSISSCGWMLPWCKKARAESNSDVFGRSGSIWPLLREEEPTTITVGNVSKMHQHILEQINY